ncbi:MAG: hypothetical protein QXF35_01990 [Candidatus Bilamarchaeaceae archaeon]
MVALFKNMLSGINKEKRVLAKASKELNIELEQYWKKRDFERLKELIGEEKLLQLKYASAASSYLPFFSWLSWENAEKVAKLTLEFECAKKEAESISNNDLILKRTFVEILQKLEEAYGERNIKKFKEYKNIDIKDEPLVLIEKVDLLFKALRAEKES